MPTPEGAIFQLKLMFVCLFFILLEWIMDKCFLLYTEMEWNEAPSVVMGVEPTFSFCPDI